MKRLPGRRAVLLVLTLTLAGCGELAGPEGEESTPPPGSTPASTSSRTRSAPKQGNIIAWLIGLGPDSPAGPVAGRAVNTYQAVQKHTCQPSAPTPIVGTKDELGDGKDLYVGTVAACMAALRDGGKDAWATAEAALKSVESGEDQSDGTCLDGALRVLLQRLVKAHREQPARPFTAQQPSGGASRPPPCPAVDGIRPASGGAGTEITITGKNLAEVDVLVYWHDNEAYAKSRDGWGNRSEFLDFQQRTATTIRISMIQLYEMTPPRKVRIAVKDQDAGVIDSAVFTYDG